MIRIIFPALIVFTLGTASPAIASKDTATYPGPYQADIYYVTDGDTLFGRVLLWPGLFVDVDIRINGVDTPETWRPKCDAEKAAGQAATQYLVHLLGSRYRGAALGSPLAKVTLKNVKLGSFSGRVIADVFYKGESVSQALIAAGHGREYFGGTRDGWC